MRDLWRWAGVLCMVVACDAPPKAWHTAVKGPTSQPHWYKVECQEYTDCIDWSGRVCHGGYEQAAGGNTQCSKHFDMQHTEGPPCAILIRCK